MVLTAVCKISNHCRRHIYLRRHGSLSKIAHILRHNTNLWNFKKGKATLHILFDHKEAKFKIYGKQIPNSTQIH